MTNCTDQAGREIYIPSAPQRIISLVPSQTELLFELGLNDEVVGITKFCVHPENWFHSKTRVGGTRQLNFEKIYSLHPDLIIANKEENIKEDIERLEKDFPVWVSDVNTMQDAIHMIGTIGTITGKTAAARKIISGISQSFAQLSSYSVKKTAAYLIWQRPFMVAGGDTFINDMMKFAGFGNVFAPVSRYPVVTMEQLTALNPEFILLSSEPYPFKETDIHPFKKDLPSSRIVLVDGEMFSWYGSRLLKAAGYFMELRRLPERSFY